MNKTGVKLFVGICTFCGLPLIGWGVKNSGQFFQHPARLFYIILAVFLQIVAVWRIPESPGNQEGGTKILLRHRVSMVLLQILSLSIVIIPAFGDGHSVGILHTGNWIRYAGLMFFVCGFGLTLWTEFCLSSQFSVDVAIQKDHRLVTSGPYRHIRHPRYMGIIIFVSGISMVFNSWWGLVVAGVMVPVLLWRVHDEEILLAEEFGKEWDDYAEKSWRLIPFIF